MFSTVHLLIIQVTQFGPGFSEKKSLHSLSYFPSPEKLTQKSSVTLQSFNSSVLNIQKKPLGKMFLSILSFKNVSFAKLIIYWQSKNEIMFFIRFKDQIKSPGDYFGFKSCSDNIIFIVFLGMWLSTTHSIIAQPSMMCMLCKKEFASFFFLFVGCH